MIEPFLRDSASVPVKATFLGCLIEDAYQIWGMAGCRLFKCSSLSELSSV
jgi:hypothetical protein